MKEKSETNKGITLIALVITIIVMLILVGVTVNVAMNGGLFKQTQTAKTKTDRETKREELISALVGAVNEDGLLTVEKTKTELNKIGATTTSTEFPLTVTYKGEQFIITSKGEVTISENIKEPEWWAVTAENDSDWLYEIIEGNDIRLTGYSGTNFNNITIPNVLTDGGTTYTVKEVDLTRDLTYINANMNNSFTGVLTIANGVQYNNAFVCDITELNIQKNVTFPYTSYGELTYTEGTKKCSTLFYSATLTKLVVGDNVSLYSGMFEESVFETVTCGENVILGCQINGNNLTITAENNFTINGYISDENNLTTITTGDNCTVFGLNDEAGINGCSTLNITTGNNSLFKRYSIYSISVECNITTGDNATFENLSIGESNILSLTTGNNATFAGGFFEPFDGQTNLILDIGDDAEFLYEEGYSPYSSVVLISGTIGDNAVLNSYSICGFEQLDLTIGNNAILNDNSINGDYANGTQQLIVGTNATLNDYALGISGATITLKGSPLYEGTDWVNYDYNQVIRDY